MANNSLTIHTNRFYALVLKSPIQMGWLSIINSVTNISRLGTFNDNILGKKFYNSLKIDQKFFLHQFKNKIIFDFVICVPTKKAGQNFFFTPLFFCCFLDPGSGMDKNQDPGSEINIPKWPK